jgi:hypothetical protein
MCSEWLVNALNLRNSSHLKWLVLIAVLILFGNIFLGILKVMSWRNYQAAPLLSTSVEPLELNFAIVGGVMPVPFIVLSNGVNLGSCNCQHLNDTHQCFFWRRFMVKSD